MKRLHLADLRARRLAPLALMLPVCVAVWTAYAVRANYTQIPFWDQWDVFFWLRQLELTPAAWSHWLFAQHNEHRIFFPRLVFVADYRFFHGRDVLNLVVIGLIQLLAAAFYVTMARPRPSRPLSFLALAAALPLIFSLRQWENLAWGFQVQFVGVYAAAIWGIWLFCLATAEQRVRWGVLAAAAALLVLATFNMANGVFAGVTMVLLGLLTRRRLAATASVAALTVLLLALYLHGYQRIEGNGGPATALHNPLGFVSYVATYLGNVWTYEPQHALAIGLVGIVLTLAMAWRVLRTGKADPVQAALLGVVLFVGVSASVTAVGRLGLGVGQALSSRYTTPTAHFWAAQIVFWSLAAQHAGKARVQAIAAVLLLALGIQGLRVQRAGQIEMLAVHERILLATSALLGEIDDIDALTSGAYPRIDMVHDLAPFLRERRLAVFAGAPPLKRGAPLPYPIAPHGACLGAFDVLIPSPSTPSALHARGWGWDVKAQRPFGRVIITGGHGKVVGTALGGALRQDVPPAVRQVTRLDSGWTGVTVRGRGDGAVAYGVTGDGKACELGRIAWPAGQPAAAS